MKDYFVFAFKNLKRRGLRSWLTLLGIFIGIASVVSLISLGAALKDTVNSQFGISSTDLITIQAGGLNSYGPPGSGAVNPLTKKDMEEIKKLSLVEISFGRNIEILKTKFNKKTNFIYYATIPDDEIKKKIYEFEELKIKEGRFISTGDNNVVLLGNDLTNKDKNGFDKIIKPEDRLEIQNKNFTVIGILEKKGSFTIDQAILIQEKSLNALRDTGDTFDIIIAKVKSKEDMDLAKKNIEKLLRERRNVKEGEEDFQVSTPEASLATVNQILIGIQIFIVMIASISILVGSIGVANTMYASVLERKKEIGTMKAIGARNSEIFKIFLFESAILGLIAGIVGVLLGFLFTFIGEIILIQLGWSFLKPAYPWYLFLGCILFALLTGSFAGLIPAINASRKNPVDSLRYE